MLYHSLMSSSSLSIYLFIFLYFTHAHARTERDNVNVNDKQPRKPLLRACTCGPIKAEICTCRSVNPCKCASSFILSLIICVDAECFRVGACERACVSLSFPSQSSPAVPSSSLRPDSSASRQSSVMQC